MSNNLGQIYATSKDVEKYIILDSQNVEVSGNFYINGTNSRLPAELENSIRNYLPLTYGTTDPNPNTLYDVISEVSNNLLISNNDASFGNVDITGSNVTVSNDLVVSGNLTVNGNLVGNVTGIVSSLSNHTTDELSEGSTNKYFSTSLVDSHLEGGTGVTYSNGSISIGQPVGISDNVKFNNVTIDGNVGINTTDPTHRLQVVGDIKGDNLILGEDGETPKIDMLYALGAAAIWDTKIEIGKSDDFTSSPAYPPSNAYGMNVQANSDAFFVGIETYDSGSNWRPLLKWGDDSTDTPFTIQSHASNHKWEFRTDGRLDVPNVVKGASGTVCKIHILPFTDAETANTSSTGYNIVVSKSFTKTVGTNLFGEVSINYTINGYGDDTFDAQLVFSTNPTVYGGLYNIIYDQTGGGGGRSGDINGAAVYTDGTATANSGSQEIYLQARRNSGDDPITFKAGFFKVTEIWAETTQ